MVTKKVGEKMNRKLKAARVENGLTQIQLAKLIEMPISTYRKKETGETEFTVSEALKVSKILNKQVEEIFFNYKVSKMDTKSIKEA